MLRRRPILLALALACAAATAALWFVAVEPLAGRRLDVRVFLDVHRAFPPSLDDLLRGITTLADLPSFVVGAIALVALAWLRRGPRAALVIALVLLCANAVTQLLQPALADPRRVDFGALEPLVSWPSGHATAAMALALGAVLVAGPRLRAIAALGGGIYAVAVGVALIAQRGHFASDVLAGYLVAGTFAAVGAVALAGIPAASAGARPRAPSLAPLLGSLAAGAVLATALVKAAVKHRDELLGASGSILLLAAIGAGGLALAAGVGLVVVRRSRG